MAGFQTHALIGGVAGLALTQALDVPLTPTAGPGWLMIGGAMVLATLPDIDEPNSWIARHVRGFVALLLAIAGGLAGWRGWWLFGLEPLAAAPQPARALVGLVAGGFLLGPALGWLLLKAIRRGMMGHRRLTHSLVVAAALTAGGWYLWAHQNSALGALGVALGFAIVVHDIGDVVTPAGVPLLYPLSSRRIGLPKPVARHGEMLVGLLAIGLAALLLRQMTTG